MCDDMLKRLLALSLIAGLPWAPSRAQAKPQRTAAPSGAEPAAALPDKRAEQRSAGKSQGSPTSSNSETASPPPPKPEKRSASGKQAGKVTKKKEPPPCLAAKTHVVRMRGSLLEQRDLALTYCDGRPNPEALDSLSVLARPRDVEAPAPQEIRAYLKRPLDRGPLGARRNPAYLAPTVMRIHPELLVRMQQIAGRFPGKTVELVSGHRPEARDTSRHHHGHALDLRVMGVARERLRDFARTLDRTGVGYYPNSVFVHIDVRDDKGYWVDRSGPGEAADYGAWPPPKQEIERASADVLKRALADLSGLGTPCAGLTRPQRTGAAHRQDDEGGDALTAAEVARIRADALKALAALR